MGSFVSIQYGRIFIPVTFLCGQNYGSFFDLATTGIDGGPVKLIGTGNATMDLSSNRWSYKVKYRKIIQIIAISGLLRNLY